MTKIDEQEAPGVEVPLNILNDALSSLCAVKLMPFLNPPLSYRAENLSVFKALSSLL